MANRVNHLGIIMDGNRRWARKHMLAAALKGHEKGADTFVDACVWCQDAGIRYLTVYAFSTENWNRSQEEVSGLMGLIEKLFCEQLDNCLARDIRMILVGDKSRLDPKTRQTIETVEEKTAHCRSLIVQMAVSYGGRDEILRAVKAYAADVAAGKARTEDLDEAVFEQYLDTAGAPDMDLVIRTGGNHRLSNFFPWQTTYSEIWFTDILWPDFTQADLQEALDYYENIQINKGK